jgi:hypothetical protein
MNLIKLGLAFSLLYLLVGLLTLPDYGVNWDEPAHFFRGQTLLNFFVQGKTDFNDLPILDFKTYTLGKGYYFPDNVRRSIYQDSPLSYYEERILDKGRHPPLTDIFAALSNYILFQKLGVSPDVESHNYVPLFLAAVLVGCTFIWVSRVFGAFEGAVAASSLALFPLFFAEQHYNIKDVPETVFFSLSVFFYYLAVKRVSLKYLILFSLAAGFAFATKFNIVFLAFILGPWTLYYVFPHLSKKSIAAFVKTNWKFLVYYCCIPVVVLGIFVLSWYPLWHINSFRFDFIVKTIQLAFGYYKDIGTSDTGFKLYPLYYVFFATPLVMLFYCLAGIVAGFLKLSKDKRAAFFLILLWFAVPILRAALPKTTIYAGVRQIMEYIPAFCILAGIGAEKMALWLNGFIAKKRFKQPLNHTAIQPLKLFQAGILLCYIPLLFKLISLHPHEGVFFNSLIGGLSGAVKFGVPDAGNSLGNPYREGVNWINANAAENAKLAFAHDLMTNIPHIWVRNDITFDNWVKSGFAREGEYIISTTQPSPQDDKFEIRYLNKFLNPVYETRVDGIPLLKIWKNDVEHTKEEYRHEAEIKPTNIVHSSTSVTIILSQVSEITRLVFELPQGITCDERAIAGRAEFIAENKRTGVPILTYPANWKLPYKKPFYLFAGEEAERIVIDTTDTQQCLLTSTDVRVFRVAQ